MSGGLGALVSDTQVISIPDTVLFQQVEEETVLLNVQSGEYFGLNAIGSTIWNLLQEGRAVGEIISHLLTEYEVSEEQLREDVGRFLLQLRNKGLIRIGSIENDE